MAKFQITLKAARINAGLTLSQAAYKIGIGKNTLIKWEKNSGLVNTVKHQQIANAYNISIDFIFFGTIRELNSVYSKTNSTCYF